MSSLCCDVRDDRAVRSDRYRIGVVGGRGSAQACRKCHPAPNPVPCLALKLGRYELPTEIEILRSNARGSLLDSKYLRWTRFRAGQNGIVALVGQSLTSFRFYSIERDTCLPANEYIVCSVSKPIPTRDIWAASDHSPKGRLPKLLELT